nr:hypothetical protein KitaXyl93_78850 [Kitasatospora sp. Xyl93]
MGPRLVPGAGLFSSCGAGQGVRTMRPRRWLVSRRWWAWGAVVEGEGVGDAEGEVAVGGEGGQSGQGLAVGGDPHVGDPDAA